MMKNHKWFFNLHIFNVNSLKKKSNFFIKVCKSQPAIFIEFTVCYLTLFYAALFLDFSWNFFSFQPSFDFTSNTCLCLMALSAFCLFKISKFYHNFLNLLILIFPAIWLLGLAFIAIQPDELTDGFFCRDVVAPLWYRMTIFTFLSLPSVFMMFGPLKYHLFAIDE